MDTNCPKCFKSLSFSPQNMSHLTFCSNCGWKKTHSKKKITSLSSSQKQLNQSIIAKMALISLFLLFGLMHFSQWGKHSINIVYLKLSSGAGLAGHREYKKISEICRSLKKYECLENTLQKYYQKTQSKDVLKQLAELQLRLNKQQAALASYQEYLNKHSFELQAAFNFAQLLTKENKIEQAIRMYNKILSRQGRRTISLKVLRNQVLLLKKTNRIQEAQRLIKKYASIIPDTDTMLKQEFNKLAKILSTT